MLAKVLLQIHNIHHYYVFFQSLQTAIKEDKLDRPLRGDSFNNHGSHDLREC